MRYTLIIITTIATFLVGSYLELDIQPGAADSDKNSRAAVSPAGAGKQTEPNPETYPDGSALEEREVGELDQRTPDILAGSSFETIVEQDSAFEFAFFLSTLFSIAILVGLQFYLCTGSAGRIRRYDQNLLGRGDLLDEISLAGS